MLCCEQVVFCSLGNWNAVVSPGSLSSSVFSLGGAARAVIGLLHTDMHQRGTVGSVGHLATCIITVAPGTKAEEAVAKITKRLKSGKVIQDVGISIGEGGVTLPVVADRAKRFLFPGGSFQHPRGFYSCVTGQSQPSQAQTR